MVERKLRTLLSLVVLAAACLGTGHPSNAADVSSSGSGGVAQQVRLMQAIERQLLTVKQRLADEFATLEALETRIRDDKDLDSVPRELVESTVRIKAMDDELVKLGRSTTTVGVRLKRIRDDALRRRDAQVVRAAEHALGRQAQLQTNIKIAGDDVIFARATVSRLWDLLGK